MPGTPRVQAPEAQFLQGLQRTMRGLAVPAPRHHCNPKNWIPTTLNNAAAVYVRHDARRAPLQRPYDGPFRVIRRGSKSFVINRNGAETTISVDRLKPAFAGDGPSGLDPPEAPPPDVPDPAPPDMEHLRSVPTTTRFGRVSRPPERLNL